ncbi:MAG TPA: AzlD domain-containing protein [Syntrophomonadaceae bacterium]|nr:AzlD domain-containing protein [Syntrophomonadaceae bacterium]HQD90030.1 AzlD domain-containing protein [Syntrophomonadaceae bacterium]
MSSEAIWLTIIGASLATLLPRILPVALFSGLEFPEILIKWLSYVAPAVLGALTAVSILAPEGQLYVSVNNMFIWAFIPTMLIAVKTRSLFWTLSVGIVVMAILYNLTV